MKTKDTYLDHFLKVSNELSGISSFLPAEFSGKKLPEVPIGHQFGFLDVKILSSIVKFPFPENTPTFNITSA